MKSTIIITVILLLSSRQTANAEEKESNSVNSETGYGERLAESSFISSTVNRDRKEETNYYSTGINAILNSDGFLNQMDKYGDEPKYTPNGPVEMAVHTKKTVEVIPVRFEEPKDGEPQVIEISPYEVPLSIVFKTQTNKLNVNQEHKSEAAEEVKETSSEEEPHRVVHNVYRPVIQEVTEVIQPFRKVLQKVEPVIEEMKTIISKAAPNGGSGAQQPVQQHQPYQAQQQSQRNAGGGGGGGAVSSGGGMYLMHQGDNRLSYSGSSGMSYSPMAYSSELINNIAATPSPTTSAPSSGVYTSSGKNELSRRTGVSQPNNVSITSHTKNVLNETELPIDSNYNELIHQYIHNFLHHKKSQFAQENPHINPNSIKIFNLPMKQSASDEHVTTVKKSDMPPKYKIIKEFRFSLNDIKKELINKRLREARLENSFKNRNLIGNFQPIHRSGYQYGRQPRTSASTRRSLYVNPKRFGDSPVSQRPRPSVQILRRSEHTRNVNYVPRRFPGQNIYNQRSKSLRGISPPNILFSHGMTPKRNHWPMQ